MKHPVLTPEHPYWDLYIRFHSGQLDIKQREQAKMILFPIHYGMTDTSQADVEVLRLKGQEASPHNEASKNMVKMTAIGDVRLQTVTEEEFRLLLLAKKIRPASLEDVHGTHHSRQLYKHPRTGQFYVRVR